MQRDLGSGAGLDGHSRKEPIMAKASVRRAGDSGATRGRAVQQKDTPDAACIVCGSVDWCECEWDHFYGESVPVPTSEKEPEAV